MSKPMITVEGLGKAYRLGQQEEKYPTFRDALVGAAKAPLKRFRHLSGGGREDELFWALKDVSFEVNQGEVVGIIGRNGAGKSTLLKVLSRITEPTAGRAVLRGRVASLLEVGTGFHPELTGRENIYLNGSILGMKKAEIDRKFDEIVAFAEVEKFLDTPVKRYSSGMYVRLAFAVAAHLEPEILIVDEVLAVGDAQFQKKCLGKMQDVAKGEGRTVLFVSHNMAAVSSLCSTGIYLADGVIASTGPACNLIAEYYQESKANGLVSEWETHTPDISTVTSEVFLSSQANADDVVIRLTIEAKKVLPRLGLSIAVQSPGHELVSEMMPGVTGLVHTAAEGSNTIDIRMPAITHYLTSGTYRFSLGLHEYMVREIASCENAASLTINSRNRYGQLIAPKYGSHGSAQLPVQFGS